MSEALRVLIADDNRVVRMGLEQIIDSSDGLELVGSACDGQEAIDLGERLRPDVCLLDVRMPRRDGVSAARELSQITTVVMLTHSEESEIIEDALEAGAKGYVVYHELDVEGLSHALRSVVRGSMLMSSTAADVILSNHTRRKQTGSEHIPEHSGGSAPFGLSRREHEVMELAADGLTNRQIAQRLFLSEKTVKNHINRIFSKLDVANRAEAVSVWFKKLR